MGFCSWFKRSVLGIIKGSPSPDPVPFPPADKPKDPVTPPKPITPPKPADHPNLQKGLRSTVWYGSLHRFGGQTDLMEAIKKMAKYDLLVFPWDCCLVRNPDAKQNHDDAVSAIQQLKTLNPNTKVFGYVPLGTSEGQGNMMEEGHTSRRINRALFKEKVLTWKQMGAHGIFIDMFCDDETYDVSVEDQRYALNTIHAAGMPAIMNGWFMQEIYYPDAENEIEDLFWEGRDLYMFEDMGSHPDRDAEKLARFNSLNTKGLLSFGVGYIEHKNSKTEAIGAQMNYFGWAENDYGG